MSGQAPPSPPPPPPAPGDARLPDPLWTEVHRVGAELALPGPTARPKDRRGEDLFWLVHEAREALFAEAVAPQGYPAFARTEANRGRLLGFALASLDPLMLGEGRRADVPEGETGAASSEEPIAAIGAGPEMRRAARSDDGVGLIEPAPELFARLASLARAVANALREGDDFPSRERIVADLADLDAAFRALAEGARAELEGRPLPPGSVDVLYGAAGFARRFAAFRPDAARVLSVVVAPDGRPTFATRIVRGPIAVLAIAPAPGSVRGPLALSRGAALATYEIATERRLGREDVAALPELMVPVWLRPLLSPPP